MSDIIPLFYFILFCLAQNGVQGLAECSAAMLDRQASVTVFMPRILFVCQDLGIPS